MIPDPSSVFQSQDMKPFKKISSPSSCIPGWRVYIPHPRDLRFACGKQSSLGGELLFGEQDPPARARTPRAAPQSEAPRARAGHGPGPPWQWGPPEGAPLGRELRGAGGGPLPMPPPEQTAGTTLPEFPLPEAPKAGAGVTGDAGVSWGGAVCAKGVLGGSRPAQPDPQTTSAKRRGGGKEALDKFLPLFSPPSKSSLEN